MKTDNGVVVGAQYEGETWAPGMQAAQKRAQLRRENHQQRITQADTTIRSFDGAQFIAYIGRNIRTLLDGSIAVTFRVPYEYRHYAPPLFDAVGIPLSVDIQVWKPYEDAVEREQEI